MNQQALKRLKIASITTGFALITCAGNAAVVSYDANAPISNFDTPGNANNNVAYTTSITSDSTYVTMSVTSAGNINGLNFANFYLATDYPGGSTLGFSVNGSTQAVSYSFIPGGANYYNVPTASDGFIVSDTQNGASTTLALEVPWTFFTTDPDGMNFEKISADNDVLRLDLSQSFGCSVAGGSADYGSDELGTTEYTPVPEASTWIAGGLLLLPFAPGTVRKLKKARA